MRTKHIQFVKRHIQNIRTSASEKQTEKLHRLSFCIGELGGGLMIWTAVFILMQVNLRIDEVRFSL